MASASRLLHLARLPTAAAASSRLLRPLAAAGSLLPAAFPSSPAHPSPARGRFFSTQQANSSLRDTSPNWSNRPPKETILLDGCDFEHWLVVLEPPPGDAANPEPTREEIIDGYIKTLAEVVGSEEEARLKIYSVSTRHYFAFGALVSEEVSYKLKELPKVRWVLPDSYLDVIKKDYGGEPFINGEAVPYDPKYHEEWVRNNARANERSRRNDRPRNFDRSKNFERRRENMQNFQNRDAPPNQGFNSQPPPGQGFNSPPPGPGFNSTPPPGQNPVPPRDVPPMRPPPGNMPPPPAQQNAGYNYQQGGSPGYQNGPPGYQAGNQGYQGNPGGPVPAYQSNNPGYQGGGPGYQGGNQPPPQSGIPPPYNQGVNPGYGNGGAPGYQGQGGNPSYQQGSNNYNGGPPAYESDAPGRRYQ